MVVVDANLRPDVVERAAAPAALPHSPSTRQAPVTR